MLLLVLPPRRMPVWSSVNDRSVETLPLGMGLSMLPVLDMVKVLVRERIPE